MINKIIFIAINFLLFSNAVFSQVDKPISKGNYLLGGNFSGVYRNENGGYNNFSISMYPSIGIFVFDGFAVGAIPSFVYSRTKYDDKISSSHLIGIGPFAKYYFIGGVTLKLSTSYNYYPGNHDSSRIKNKSFYNISPGIGYAYFINDKVSLEALLNYMLNIENEYWDKQKTNVLALNIGFQIFL